MKTNLNSHAKAALATLFTMTLAACGANSQLSNARPSAGDGLAVVPRQAGNGDATAAAQTTKSAQLPGSPAAPAPAPAPAPAGGSSSSGAAAPQAGVRNFQQISATMALLTGEPASTPAVATAFAALTTSLPTTNDVTAFGGSNQVAIFKLAVEYCNALTADTAKAPAAYGTLNLTQPLGTAFTAANAQAFATALIAKFWGSNLASLPDQTESVADITGLINSLVQGKDPTSTTLTPAIATAACAAVLSAAPVTLF